MPVALGHLGCVNHVIVQPKLLGGNTQRKAYKLREVQHGHAIFGLGDILRRFLINVELHLAERAGSYQTCGPGSRSAVHNLAGHAHDGFFCRVNGVETAAVKALGTGFSDGIGLLDVEVMRGPAGQPLLRLHGSARQRAEAMGMRAAHISISHDRNAAVAVVVLEA